MLQCSHLTEKDHIRKGETCQSQLTQIIIVQETLQEWTANMMRKRTQHDVLHIVLTFLIRREQVVLMLETQYEPNATDFTLPSLLMMSSQIFALYYPVRLTWKLWSSSSYLVWIFFAWPASQNIVFCFFQGSEYFGLFVFIGFLTFDRLVKSRLLPTLVLGLLENGLAESVPVLIQERWLPSFVFHILGVDESAQCTIFICTQCQLIRSFRATASRKSVVNFGFTTFLDSTFLSSLPS